MNQPAGPSIDGPAVRFEDRDKNGTGRRVAGPSRQGETHTKQGKE